MSNIISIVWKPALATVALVGSLLAAGVADAGHYRRPCNPAAESHMKTAIHLMNVACGKPYHASKGIARGALTNVKLAQRFSRVPAAQAELCAARRILERYIFSHCEPPFHGAIARTQRALEIERSACFCSCGRPTCRGGCQATPHVDPHWGDGVRQPTIDPYRSQPPYGSQLDVRRRGFGGRFGTPAPRLDFGQFGSSRNRGFDDYPHQARIGRPSLGRFGR